MGFNSGFKGLKENFHSFYQVSHVAWPSRSVTGISQKRPLPTGLTHVGFAEDKLALIEVSLAVLRVSPASVTVPLFHTHYRSKGR